MDKDLVLNITALLDEGFQIIMKYGEAIAVNNTQKYLMAEKLILVLLKKCSTYI